MISYVLLNWKYIIDMRSKWKTFQRTHFSNVCVKPVNNFMNCIRSTFKNTWWTLLPELVFKRMFRETVSCVLGIRLFWTKLATSSSLKNSWLLVDKTALHLIFFYYFIFRRAWWRSSYCFETYFRQRKPRAEINKISFADNTGSLVFAANRRWMMGFLAGLSWVAIQQIKVILVKFLQHGLVV